MALSRWAALALALVVAGCQPVTTMTLACPYLRTYDKPTQERALHELQGLPRDAALRQFMGDYATLRDQVRACRRGVK